MATRWWACSQCLIRMARLIRWVSSPHPIHMLWCVCAHENKESWMEVSEMMEWKWLEKGQELLWVFGVSSATEEEVGGLVRLHSFFRLHSNPTMATTLLGVDAKLPQQCLLWWSSCAGQCLYVMILVLWTDPAANISYVWLPWSVSSSSNETFNAPIWLDLAWFMISIGGCWKLNKSFPTKQIVLLYKLGIFISNLCIHKYNRGLNKS